MKSKAGCSALLLTLIMPCMAGAQGWLERNVTDHLRGKIGTGVWVKGKVEDERRRTHDGELVANCADNSTTMYVGSDQIFIGGDSAPVAWSFDGGPIQKGSWNTCTDNRCTGLWHGNGIPFLKLLFDKNVLKITIRRYDSQQIYGTFNITGAKVALDPIGQACGWLPKPK